MPTISCARWRLRSCLVAAVLLFGIFGVPSTTVAQVPEPITVSDTLQEVRLTDGSVLIGRVAEVAADRVVLITRGGTRVEVERAQIASLRAYSEAGGGTETIADAHRTRLIFAPTGRMLSAGEGSVGVFELFFPFVSYGATDWLTLSGGTPVFPGVIGEIFYLAPKLRVYDSPRLQVSGGVLAFFTTDEIDAGSAGILYGVGTWGGPDRALTVGAGWPFIASGSESDVEGNPAVLVGGESRLGTHTKLLTENYFVFGESGALLSGGLRFFGERFSADVGAGALLGMGESWCCLPLLNFVYSFGQDR